MKIFQKLFGSVTQDPGSSDGWNLDEPLLYFSPKDPWRIRDAVEGTEVFGATGSGKTSGSGAALTKAFLNAGFGGLVLTAKPDERTLWERYCQETGRDQSLLVVSPSNKWKFNALQYEFARPGVGAGLTQNLLTLFSTLIEVAERGRGASSSQDYWERALKQLMRNAIDLAGIGCGRVFLHELHEIVISAPQSPADLASEDWRNNSFCIQCVRDGEAKEKTPVQTHDFELAAKYWLKEFPNLAEKTRSIIVSSFTSLV